MGELKLSSPSGRRCPIRHLQWVQTYSSTRSLCSIERSNTLTDQYLEDLNFVRAHQHYQNNSRR
jgi:hypothetical protein